MDVIIFLYFVITGIIVAGLLPISDFFYNLICDLPTTYGVTSIIILVCIGILFGWIIVPIYGTYKFYSELPEALRVLKQNIKELV